jgi:hypothetical protein
MSRLAIAALMMVLLPVAAFTQDGPRELADRGEPADRTQAQLQRNITDLYLSNFKEQVGLSDDQFLNVAPIVRNFIDRRFQVANRRRQLEERENQLLSQPNPSEAEVQRLNEELSSLDESAAMDARFMRNLQSQLSDRQLLAARQFHRNFINDKLPRAIERLRAQNPARGQQPQRPPAARSNPQPNRRDQPPPQTRPGAALRGRQAPRR